MKLPKPLAFALAGWVASVAATIALGAYWPTIFPAILENEHYYGIGPKLASIIGLAILVASPAAIIGGLVGSRIPREGGRGEQFLMAALTGIVFGLSFACLGFWFFTGW